MKDKILAFSSFSNIKNRALFVSSKTRLVVISKFATSYVIFKTT